MVVPNLWRTKKQRYHLQAEVCPTCTKAVFPPREICPYCHQNMGIDRLNNAQPGFSLWLNLPQMAAVGAAGDD